MKLKIFVVILSIITIYVVSITAYTMLLCPKLEYRAFVVTDEKIIKLSTLQPEYAEVYDRETARRKVAEALDMKCYLYFEVDDFNINAKGKVFAGKALQLIRTVVIANKYTQDSVYYTYVFAHELMHIKTMSGNERYVEFETIKALYESGDEMLIDVAKWAIQRQLSSNAFKDYDCLAYLYDYLFNE